MNKKKMISLLMVLVLILGMSPVSSVSAKVNSGSFSFVAYPNRPAARFTVTCRAFLSGKKMTGSFSYTYPSTPHYLQEYTQEMRIEASTNNRYSYDWFSGVDYATMDLDFYPDYTSYEYFFNRDSKGTLYL